MVSVQAAHIIAHTCRANVKVPTFTYRTVKAPRRRKPLSTDIAFDTLNSPHPLARWLRRWSPLLLSTPLLCRKPWATDPRVLEKLVKGGVAEGWAIRGQRAQVEEFLEYVVER
jgi:hypothetical protein